MTYKSAGVVGVLSFGVIKDVLGDTASMVLLTGFFAVGLGMLLRVRETQGVRAARRTERDNEASGGTKPPRIGSLDL